ncbi:MAG: DUF896 domain-containing protein [Lachnospiraceae bacterium]|jgi:uncharacterized protein YnzC (UPF0291/DUF896 family)
MEEQKIKRINELAHKSKSVGLTEEEKVEQQHLRREFIESFKMNLKCQLDNIDVEQEDGTIINLGDKYGNKTRH